MGTEVVAFKDTPAPSVFQGNFSAAAGIQGGPGPSHIPLSRALPEDKAPERGTVGSSLPPTLAVQATPFPIHEDWVPQ